MRADNLKNVDQLSIARVVRGVCGVRGHISTRHNRQSSKGGSELH